MPTMTRVDSIWTGPEIRGGGITQFYFIATAASNQDIVDLVDAFWDTLVDVIAVGNSVTVDNVVTLITDTDGSLTGAESVTTAGPHDGTATGDVLPPATQALIRWFTGLVANNRLVRGHTFIPAMTEPNSDASGRPSTALLGELMAAGEAMALGPDPQQVIWHRPNGASPGASANVIAVGAWSEWAVLRGRRD